MSGAQRWRSPVARGIWGKSVFRIFEVSNVTARKSGLGAGQSSATGRAHKRSGAQAGAEWRQAGLVRLSSDCMSNEFLGLVIHLFVNAL